MNTIGHKVIKGIHLRVVEIDLGAHYIIGRRVIKFVKVTRKGYNFVDINTHKCVFSRSHLYNRNKDPEGQPHFYISDNINFLKVM